MHAWRFTRLRVIVLLLGVFALLLPVGSRAASDGEFRWDIINVDFVTGEVSAGGVASALANDGSKITLTGSGTFDRGNSEVSGGGTWNSFPSAGDATGGTYKVTGFVSFTVAPGDFGTGIDLIGNAADARAGLAVLRISYSDGSEGVLVISCHLPSGTPSSVLEGITASKGFVDYWNRVAPTPGVNAGNRTVFHVQ